MPASSRPGPVDAIAFLIADHERLKKLFKQFRFLCFTRATTKAEKVARLICHEWTMHTRVEEEIFYPEARAAIDNPQIIDDAEADRAMASELIAQIMGGSIADKKFAARVGMLAEYVKHHVREEQLEVFPRVRRAKLDMSEIGERIAARKLDLAAEIGAAENSGSGQSSNSIGS